MDQRSIVRLSRQPLMLLCCFKEGEEETPVNDPSIEDLPEQSARFERF